MNRLRQLLGVLLILLFIGVSYSCRTTPDGIIPPDKMALLLADVYVGEAAVESSGNIFNTDSARRAFKQSIFKKHGVDITTVDTSLYWYGRNLEEYMKVCDKTEEILQARIAEAEKKGATQTLKATSTDGDSVNLWTAPSIRRISPSVPSEFITFSIPRDKNWERGDRFTISSHGVLTRNLVNMMLAVDYSDGTTEFISFNDKIDERAGRLTLTLDSAKTGSTVYGYIRYLPDSTEVSYIDSISLVRTRGMNNNASARKGQQTARFR